MITIKGGFIRQYFGDGLIEVRADLYADSESDLLDLVANSSGQYKGTGIVGLNSNYVLAPFSSVFTADGKLFMLKSNNQFVQASASGGGTTEGGGTTPTPVTTFTKGFRDLNVLPDSRNTGCHGTLTSYMTALGGVASGNTTTLTAAMCQEATNLVFENVNFDHTCLVINKTASQLGITGDNPTITFKNCNFDARKSTDDSMQYYNVSNSSTDVKVKFINCTFQYASAAACASTATDVEFYSCYACNMGGDGFKMSDGIKLIDCYVGPCGFTSGAHADGVQFSSGTKAYIKNYRCDAIPIKDVNVYNAGIYFDYESGDVTTSTDIVIDTFAVNGGGYSTFFIEGTGYSLEGLNVTHGEYGCSYHYGGIQTSANVLANNDLTDITAATKAYVSSVWKEGDNIKFLATNYTNSQVTLDITTSVGTYTRTLNACPTYAEYYDTYTSVSQFPFDVEFSVPTADFIVIKQNGVQIRFVDFTPEGTYTATTTT